MTPDERRVLLFALGERDISWLPLDHDGDTADMSKVRGLLRSAQALDRKFDAFVRSLLPEWPAVRIGHDSIAFDPPQWFGVRCTHVGLQRIEVQALSTALRRYTEYDPHLGSLVLIQRGGGENRRLSMGQEINGDWHLRDLSRTEATHLADLLDAAMENA